MKNIFSQNVHCMYTCMYVDIHENVYESNIIYIYIYYNIYCVGARKLSKSNNTMYICACVLLHKCTFTMYMCIYYFFFIFDHFIF